MAINQISTATNITGPNIAVDPNNASKYLNNLFTIDLSVGASNDAIVAYFEEMTGSASAGQSLAAAVLYTAKARLLDPMQVLADFKKMSNNQLNTYLASFLNFNRVPSSQLGVRSSTNTLNPNIARTILP
jgi:hypothetical protein